MTPFAPIAADGPETSAEWVNRRVQNRPTITVVICARNAAGHLERSLPALRQVIYPRTHLRVLVVDNGSTDGTADIARSHGAAVRHCRRPGVVHARQRGWRAARSEFVAFLDADCIPPPDWLERTLRPFEDDPRLAAAGVRLVPGPVRTLAERHIVEAGILDTDRFRERNALQFPFLVTAGMVLRRAALEEVGGFDTALGRATGEDADLCWRLERAGWRTQYLPEVEIVHHHRSTILQMLRQVRWYGMASAFLFARWRGELGWWRYTDWQVYRRLGRGAVQALPALLGGEDRYARVRPLLEVLDAAAFLTGKWEGALRNRVLFL